MLQPFSSVLLQLTWTVSFKLRRIFGFPTGFWAGISDFEVDDCDKEDEQDEEDDEEGGEEVNGTVFGTPGWDLVTLLFDDDDDDDGNDGGGGGDGPFNRAVVCLVCGALPDCKYECRFFF